MSDFSHRFIETNGIRMHVAEAGAGYPVVMCHGFPELWYSWRHQMRALASAGFRAVAPDQRGYGDTGGPEPIGAYTQREIVADLIGMLDAMEIEKCVVVGHDWGGFVAWNAALMAPARIERVIALNTPFFPRTPVKPMDFIRAIAAGKFNYIVYFQEPGVAEAELGRDVRRSLRSFYQGGELLKGDQFAELRKLPSGVLGPAGGGVLDHLPDLPHGSFLSAEDFEVFVRAFEKTGFRQPLNWYRNIDRNWEESEGLPAQVNQPALMITAELDIVLRPEMANGMQTWVPNLRKTVLIEGSGHWTQQEKPEEVNRALLEFLADLRK
jgi:pimeloyl-ACP methyl ester carboxylesterase